AKICWNGAITDGPPEVGVQSQDHIHIEPVRSNKALTARIAATLLQPCDVLVAREKRVLAIYTLTGPVGNPVRCVFEELRGAKRVGQQDEEFALVGLLPKFEHPVLRILQLFF